MSPSTSDFFGPVDPGTILTWPDGRRAIVTQSYEQGRQMAEGSAALSYKQCVWVQEIDDIGAAIPGRTYDMNASDCRMGGIVMTAPRGQSEPWAPSCYICQKPIASCGCAGAPHPRNAGLDGICANCETTDDVEDGICGACLHICFGEAR